MTTMREALTNAAEQFEFYAREHRAMAASYPVVIGSGDMRAVSLRKAETNDDVAKMCRDALAENDAAIKKNEAWLKADLDRALDDSVGWFFRPCAECQWPNICGKANPSTLANLGIDSGRRGRLDMDDDGAIRIARLTADEWDGMVKPRQILPTHRHERSGYNPGTMRVYICTDVGTYIIT